MKDRVTSHFFWSEFSQKGAHGFEPAPYPVDWIKERLAPLCRSLERIRDEWGKPITITSGYRSPEYNAKVGGAKLSQHAQGRAADFVVQGVPAREVYARVMELYRAGQLPHVRGIGSYARWVHIDVRPTVRLAHWIVGGTEGRKA